LATGDIRKLPADTIGRSQLLVTAGCIPQLVDDAEKVLVKNATSLKVFQRGSEVVRIITLESSDNHHGLLRPHGTVQLASVSAINLRETLERLIDFHRPDPKTGETKPTDCPSRVPATYLSRIGNWNIPMLAGVIEAPILRPDGTMLTTPGYDASSELYLDSALDWSAISVGSTRNAAELTLRELREPFAEFPLSTKQQSR
jgi:putative DNA primase/helicase